MTAHITFEATETASHIQKGDIRDTMTLVDRHGNTMTLVCPLGSFDDIRLAADLLTGKVHAADLRQHQDEDTGL